MCITFIINADNDLILGRFKLILLNNRDEEFSRPTSALAWCDGILAGRDEREKERGTWLGIDRNGRIGNLLSITEPKNVFKSFAPSRDCYELYSFTNRFDNSEPVHWPKGLHVFSNSPRITPFKKAIYGEKLLQSLIDQFSTKIDFTEEDLINELFEIGSNTEIHFPDEQIRLQTGSTDSKYKLLCSIFVNGHLQGRNYGTKSTSIILVDKKDNVSFYERRVLDIAKPMDDPSKFEYSVERFLLEKY
ncbi:unnamed protein product [Meloidogyne enterolobii]|uniref:Uncharacterized protein n=1 Tax=Meloidogyne enterolobii TaxID=390850 RepID=A0ACB0Z378_MELEN